MEQGLRGERGSAQGCGGTAGHRIGWMHVVNRLKLDRLIDQEVKSDAEKSLMQQKITASVGRVGGC